MKAKEAMHTAGNRTNRLTRFFVTAFAGAWLAWLPIVLGTDGLAVLPVRVPVALAFVGTFTGPMFAAFMVSNRTERRDLLARMFMVRMAPWIYAAAVLLPPVAILAVTLAFSDEAIPVSRWGLYAGSLVPFLANPVASLRDTCLAIWLTASTRARRSVGPPLNACAIRATPRRGRCGYGQLAGRDAVPAAPTRPGTWPAP
jgi:hypothetical protein